MLVDCVSHTGGHLASNLGVVELALAIETVFDTSVDRLLLDVGHQSYVHKILTGRREQFSSLRRFGGIAGYPKPEESPTDSFVAGHASDSVSVALGMARARSLLGENYHVIALLGDGATTGGLSFEGLNDAGASNEPMIVILNDNGMSIARNVGGLARHLSRIRTRPGYFGLKRAYRSLTSHIPGGRTIYRLSHSAKQWMKKRLIGSTLFEDMGFVYIGPVDGYDVRRLIYLLQIAKEMDCPVLLHVITKKGKGYPPAEENPAKFHGVGPFSPQDGTILASGSQSFSAAFGEAMISLAEEHPRLCAITAAMPEGTGLSEFAKQYPDRLFDVGIAEGHAVAMAGGLAAAGMIPVVAIYSSFLQRAYDMLFQDVSMMNLHVVFAVDRAGLVGEDGETHHGVFDVGYLRQVPGMTILCPPTLAELERQIRWAVEECAGPVAIRYPRGGERGLYGLVNSPILRPGRDITLAGYGILINNLLKAADRLEQRGISAEVVCLRSIKPLELSPLISSAEKTGRLLLAEEAGQFCGIALEAFHALECRGVRARMRSIGLPDQFVTHGSMEDLYRSLGLDSVSIAAKAEEMVRNEG